MNKVLALLVVFGLAATANASGRSLHADNLLTDAQQIIGGALSSVEGGLTNLVNNLFGSSNSWATQIPEDVQNLSWSSLENLDFTSPVADFVNSIKDKSLTSDILEAEEKVTELIDEFCTPAKFHPSKKIPSNCVGKQLAVRLAPWECKLFHNKTISCTPPFIEVIQTPAVCTAKHNTSAVFVGKVCKLEKKIGQHLEKTIGGNAFSIDISKNLLNLPHTLATSLLPGKFDSDTAFSASAAGSVSASKSSGISASGSASVSEATAGR